MAAGQKVRERMAKRVEDFTYNMLANVFSASETAPLASEAILKAKSYDLGPKSKRIEDLSDWTESKIREKAKSIQSDKGPEGDFSD